MNFRYPGISFCTIPPLTLCFIQILNIFTGNFMQNGQCMTSLNCLIYFCKCNKYVPYLQMKNLETFMKDKNPKKINTTPQSKAKKIGAKISLKKKGSSAKRSAKSSALDIQLKPSYAKMPPRLKKQSLQKHNSDENLKSEVFTPPPCRRQ